MAPYAGPAQPAWSAHIISSPFVSVFTNGLWLVRCELPGTQAQRQSGCSMSAATTAAHAADQTHKVQELQDGRGQTGHIRECRGSQNRAHTLSFFG